MALTVVSLVAEELRESQPLATFAFVSSLLRESLTLPLVPGCPT